ncbi:hypothetical protein GOP47_0021730 [Adiantum capillus-veneris]|uniref:Uncharacterized protein n=1 Tax=Adiantum capillus-veneris TaxID=13818 RepID=A0A9D4U8Y5_ADICA|nr:hypothetical protein GOP47_0021730 [Adiantum capillus-veneris]
MVRSQGRPPDPVSVLRGHRASVTALAFHDSSLLVSGDSDGELKLWDMVKRRPHISARVQTPASGVIGIGAGKTLGNKILSQGRDGTLKVWELAEGRLSREPLLIIDTEAYHFCKLSICRPASCATDSSASEMIDASTDSSDDNNGEIGSLSNVERKNYVALAGKDPSMVDVWDIDAGNLAMQFGRDTSVELLPHKKASGMCMALQAFNQINGEGFLHVVAGYEDGSLAMWDARNPKIPCLTTCLHQEPVLSIALDGPCQGGVSGSADERLILFSLDYQQNSFQMRKEVALGNPGTADISIRKDDKIVATAGWDCRVRIYDYRRSRALAKLKYHSDLVNSVCFSDDCKLLTSASKDGTIALCGRWGAVTFCK